MSTESGAAENISGDMKTRGTGSRAEAEADGCGTCDDSADQKPPLSKNQIKKQKKKERWEQIKAEKRQAEKEKRKKRLAEMRERGEDMGPTRKSLKKNRMVDSACRQRVVIDCSFDAFMTEKDTTFLVQQVQHSYAANRRADNPLQLYICGIGGKAKQRLDSIGDYKGWDMHKEERDFTEVFPKDEIMYLSSESPNVLNTLDDTKVYVIGGLVDHNHHKGLCHRLAEERGLAHAQLPIAQFLQLKSRKVLTINHVFEILLRFTETKDWQTSLLAVLPQRKGVCLKAGQDQPHPGHCPDDKPHSGHRPDDHRENSQDKQDTHTEDERREVPASIVNGSQEVINSSSCPDKAAVHVEPPVTRDTTDAADMVEEGESVCSSMNSKTKTSTSVTASNVDV